MDVIHSLFEAYIEDAQWFAVAHAVVALLVIATLIRFARWRFDDEPPPTIWQQFEIRTNFVHGLVGLFLITGIAGTFLGLWDVASNLRPSAELTSAGTQAEAAQRANETITLLLRGIAKAFPVGFVGLVLTFFANLVAGWIEAIKRQRIEAFMNTVGDPLTAKLVEALGPVANLSTTLEMGLSPVIRELEKTLKPIPIVMASQRDELANAKTALTEAAVALKESGRQISASVTGLKEMAETSHAALEAAKALSGGIRSYFANIASKLDQATERATHAFNNYDGAITTMTESVCAAADSFRQFPFELREEVTTAIVESYNHSSDAREKALSDLYASARQRFEENIINAVSSVTHSLDDVKADFQTLTTTMDRSIVNAQNAFGHYSDAWQQEAAKLREDIVQQIDPGIRNEMKDGALKALAELEALARASDGFVNATKKTTADIERMYREATEGLTKATNQLVRSLTSISHQIESSTARLETIQVQTAYQKPPGRMRRFGRAVIKILRHPIRWPWRRHA
ncbi:MAG TPA: hypothetical protein VFO89_02045 [Thermoanaerobaculia bacterium]|nr:hypothetical protein [Thermoanaerobaculia bacterium]